MSATNGILKSEKQMKSHNKVNIQELRPTIFKLLLAFNVQTKILPILVISILQYNISERKSLKPQKENQSPLVNVMVWVVTIN